MKPGKYLKKKPVNKRPLVMVLTVSLVLALTILADTTLAWLTASTDPLVNTFTTGTIGITLAESTPKDDKMIPGQPIAKDPAVTVTAGSEKCYVFVKIEESANFGTYMTYAIADGWTALPENAGIYYRVVEKKDEDQSFGILKDNKVAVKNDVDLTGLTAETYPTLTFTAYASQCQKSNDAEFTAAEAWANVNPATTEETT